MLSRPAHLLASALVAVALVPAVATVAPLAAVITQIHC
jgi:hypothetical protein